MSDHKFMVVRDMCFFKIQSCDCQMRVNVQGQPHDRRGQEQVIF